MHAQISMMDPKVKEALEWKLAQIAFEFQYVPLEDVQELLAAAWSDWNEPKDQEATLLRTA